MSAAAAMRTIEEHHRGSHPRPMCGAATVGAAQPIIEICSICGPSLHRHVELFCVWQAVGMPKYVQLAPFHDNDNSVDYVSDRTMPRATWNVEDKLIYHVCVCV